MNTDKHKLADAYPDFIATYNAALAAEWIERINTMRNDLLIMVHGAGARRLNIQTLDVIIDDDAQPVAKFVETL